MHNSGAKWVLLAVLVLLIGPAIATGEEPLREAIDRHIAEGWKKQNIPPPELCDDATFLRRVYLDLAGIIPTHDEAQAFLDDSSPDKRSQLIDRLLASPRYGIHQGDEWDMTLFGRHPPGYDAPKRDGFQRWVREAFEQNLPYDQFVLALLKAEGNTAEQGAPMYLVQYDRQPEDAARAVTQTFLGVQLQCARCHDHPYEAWTQTDFYGVAAFFARLQNVRAGKTKIGESDFEKIYVGERNTGDIRFTGSVKDAKPGDKGVPVKPKFLGGSELEEPDLSAEFKDERRIPDGNPPPAPKFSRKDKLAEWIVSPDNPYFARAAVNRFWSQYMGRGLVHPVDDMSESNPPSHPELLDLLAREFVAHKFDVKWLVREIVNSRAYQLTSGGEVAEAKPLWFERARVRPLSAEELLESWRVATWYDAIPERRAGERKGRFYGVTFDYIRRYFGEPNNGVGDFQGGLHEHLYLNNGELGRLLRSEEGGLINDVLKSEQPWEERVERMYLSVLNRRPSDEERARFVEYLNISETNQQADRVREALWVLMTCSEFRFNH